MAAPALSSQSQNATRLADPALREGLLKYARSRLPAEEVEDLVQNTLTEALVSTTAPSDLADFRRWVQGIARHKIADCYRRRERLPVLTPDLDRRAAEPNGSTGELRQWIESELPKTDGAQKALHWLLREGEGESLDEIARDLDLPAPRVRQSVSRLRRHFQARWLALGAAGLLLLLGASAELYRVVRPAQLPPSIARELATPLERARVLRQDALQHCSSGDYPECIALLDRARALDPSGDNASAIREARAGATKVEPPKVIELPAGAPAASPPDAKSNPKQQTPRKQVPKRLAPSKPQPKQPEASKFEQQNALPGQQVGPASDSPTHEVVPAQPQTLKR